MTWILTITRCMESLPKACNVVSPLFQVIETFGLRLFGGGGCGGGSGNGVERGGGGGSAGRGGSGGGGREEDFF